MQKPHPEDVLEYLEESLQAKLLFARSITFSGCHADPWKQMGYHAISTVKYGGSIHTWFEDDPERRLSRQAGDVCFLPAYRRRRVEVVTDSDREKMLFTAAGVSFRVLGNVDLLLLLDIPFLFDPDTARCLDAAIDSLLENEACEDRNPLQKAVERKKECFDILRLIVSVSRFKPDAMETIGTYGLVEPAVKKINAEYSQRLEIEELAECCFLSKSQFHHNFKRLIGMAPLEYQRQRRLEETKKLLLDGGMSIAQICKRVGWDDPFHFSRIFKRQTGYSPSSFRKRFRGGLDLYSNV